MYERIITLCKEHSPKISIRKLESDLGFGNGILHRWSDRSPSFDRVQKVADYFGVSAHWLATGEGPKYPFDLQRFAADSAQGTKKDQADPKADLVKKWLATYDMLTETERAEVDTFIQFKLSQRKREGE